MNDTGTEACRPCTECGRPNYGTYRERICTGCALRRTFRLYDLSIIILIVLLAAALGALKAKGGGLVSEQLLDDIRWSESRGNSMAIGRAGERGAYQLKPIAVREVNRVTGWSWAPADMHRDEVGRAYARALLNIYESRLARALGRAPTRELLLASYRRGISAVMRSGDSPLSVAGHRTGGRLRRDVSASLNTGNRPFPTCR